MSLHWDRFAALGGGPERNFELLWRGIVQRTWERFGQLRSVRQQPGVEFHLRLHTRCDLGEAEAWCGWQCRWYRLRADNRFRADQRKDIRESIEKTREHLPGLTDYVLCLRERPAKSDESWFFGLSDELELDGKLRLHMWAEEDLEPRLAGPAAVLKEAYFGELVLTEADLANARARSLAPVKDRWMPDLNVETRVERELAAALMRPGSFAGLAAQSARLARLARDMDDDADPLPEGARANAQGLRAALETLSARLGELVQAIDDADSVGARDLLAADLRPALGPKRVRSIARELRLIGHQAALAASAAEAEIRTALLQLKRHREITGASLVAVVGDPGSGKSHLAAEITQPSDNTPAGIFIAGRDLQKGGTLDDRVRQIPGLDVSGIDELLEAVDAAGARFGTRIPIVIDGLNEAERPHEWREELAKVQPALGRYPNLALLVTLRGRARRDVLIDEAFELPLRWTREETWVAVERYFEQYKIDPGSKPLPMWLLGDPLFLRLFCEAINGEREHMVGPESIPDDLVSVYELYRQKTAERLAHRLNLRPQLIVRRLEMVGLALWERRARDLPFEEVQEIVNEPETEWEGSLVRALELEGILSRDAEEDRWDYQRTAVLFDRFGGYLIADALMRERRVDEIEDLLGSTELWSTIAGDPQRRHPLADDIWAALVGLVPRLMRSRQLWQYAPEAARPHTLYRTLGLASDLIDQETQTALILLLAERCPEPNTSSWHPFDSLWEMRDAPTHRLNAAFLDRLLRAMPLPTRDAGWTEWLRVRADDVQQAMTLATDQWTATDVRDAQSDLDARAFAWASASTNRVLRDFAARALQRYGRANPRRVFDLADQFADVDDTYVSERLLAACLGAACTHQMPDPGGGFRDALREFLTGLAERLVGTDATAPTSHVLVRDHVRTLVDFAAALHRDAVPAGIDPATLTFAEGPTPEALDEDTERGEEISSTIHMDFGNYTVGGLYEDRGNYQFEHEDYQRGLAEIRGRVWDLGWRRERFEAIDERIAQDNWRRGRTENAGKTERYGKKYSWTAFYELAGRLSDAGRLRRRGWHRHETSADIDPTFPSPPPTCPFGLAAWASQPPEDDRRWYGAGAVEVPDGLLRATELDGAEGPWLLVDGYLNHEDPLRGREVWGHLRAMLIDDADADDLCALLEARPYLGNHFVPLAPSDGLTFAGEMPWRDGFLRQGDLGWDDPPYVARIGHHEPDVAREFEVELLSHQYSPDSSGPINEGHGAFVPSALVAREFDLRQSPGRLDLVGLDGRFASRTFAAPEGFQGYLLFLREDLLEEYAAGRALVQIAWGERRVMFDWRRDAPDWLRTVDEHQDLWRRVELRRFS